MWKYMTRRLKDHLEKGINCFDVRSSAGVANQTNNANNNSDVNKSQKQICRWRRKTHCKGFHWGRRQDDTNRHNWYNHCLNYTWFSAITWSSALVLGWYTSQLVHLNFKKKCQKNSKNPFCVLLTKRIFCTNGTILKQCSLQSLPSSETTPATLSKYENNFLNYDKYLPKYDEYLPKYDSFTLHSVSNDQEKKKTSSDSSEESSGVHSDLSADSDTEKLSDVLNSIENKLGLAAIEQGNHEDGLSLLRSAAKRNHPPALYNLGLCYEMGIGMAADDKMAMQLYRLAATREHPNAMYNLAVFYGQGRGGLSRDTQMATRLMHLAANKGQPDAVRALENTRRPAPSIEEPDSWVFSNSNNLTLRLVDNNVIPAQTALFSDLINSALIKSH